MEAYFDNANAIDVHNHLRQGGLELERHWKTHTWWHRNFATIFGMCETDAYLAFWYFHPLVPKAWLQKYPYTNRGDHCVFQTNIGVYKAPIFAATYL